MAGLKYELPPTAEAGDAILNNASSAASAGSPGWVRTPQQARRGRADPLGGAGTGRPRYPGQRADDGNVVTPL
jgi:hypothetical protein